MSVAYAAAVAGDTDFVAAMRAKADAAEVREPSSEKLIALRSAMIDAILGDADAGWARLEPYLDVINPARTPEIMAVHPLYEYLFGNLAAYQRFIAQAETLDSVALRPLAQVTQD